METNNINSHEEANQNYAFAAHLLVNQKMSVEEVKKTLIEKGVNLETASIVVEDLEKQLQNAKKEGAQKDMLYGALWCIGGVIATLADIGFIFWGAIIFGGIQFFKGLVNA